MANGQPRPAFYAAVLLVVAGLVGLALWRYGAIGSGGGQAGQIDAMFLGGLLAAGIRGFSGMEAVGSG